MEKFKTLLSTSFTAIYVRVSTARQAEEGYSIPAQIERLTHYCKAQGWENIKQYVDGGYSGSTLERPQMQKLIADAKVGKIQRVVVFKLDRLSRSQKDTLFLIEDVFLSNNIEFVSLNESLDTSSPYGKLMIGILSGFAQLERENIFLRTRIGMRERLKKGYWRGGGTLPYGYDYDSNRGILVPNDKADVVRNIFSLYLKGYSTTRIATMLQLSGDRLVANILSHKVYIGIIQNKGEEFDGLHEAIISDEIFELVQARMEARSTKARASVSKYHLLSGVIYCAECGSRMRYVKWSSGRFKLACYVYADKKRTNLHKASSCNSVPVWADDIEKLVLTDLFNLSLNLKNSESYKSKTIFDPLAAIKNKISQKENQAARLVDLFTSSENAMEKALYEKKMAQYQKEYEELIKEYEIEKATQGNRRRVDHIIAEVSNIEANWDNFTDQEKQAIIRDCIDRIEIGKDGIEIKYTFFTNIDKRNGKVA